MKNLSAFLIAAALILCFAACGGKNAPSPDTTQGAEETADVSKIEALIGTWEETDGDKAYTFNADGTGTYQLLKDVTETIVYEASDTQLTITYEGSSTPVAREYSVDGDTLKIGNGYGGDFVFTRKAAEPSESAPADDTALIEAEKQKLLGTWNMSGIDEIRLEFNEDGTGSYRMADSKNVSFTYTVSVSHKEYNNGSPYTDYMMKLEYDTGETEDIIFFFNGDTGNLCFHNSDNGGYSGVIDYAEWMRK